MNLSSARRKLATSMDRTLSTQSSGAPHLAVPTSRIFAVDLWVGNRRSVRALVAPQRDREGWKRLLVGSRRASFVRLK